MKSPDNGEQTTHYTSPSLSDAQRQLILNAVNAGIEKYIHTRKSKVPAFVDRHFSFRGALRLHRKALGKDLYRTPLNVLWLAPLVTIKISSWLLHKAGADNVASRLNSLPKGFRTDVQNEINWLIYTELLELPYQQNTRTSTKDVLLEAILQNNQLASLIDSYLSEIQQKSNDPNFRDKLEKNLQEYAGSRSAAAEIAGNLITLSSGYIAFHRSIPGVISGGSATAAAIAQKIAIAQFWLGPTLGAWYYGLFPAAASTGLVIAATGVIMAGLGLIATFTGIVTDPLQARLGIHQQRLNKFIDALGNELRGNTKAQYTIKDIYITRVFDILDLLSVALRC